MDIVAGPVWFAWRFINIGIAGFQNLRRGRHIFQNFLIVYQLAGLPSRRRFKAYLGPKCPSFHRKAKSMCILVISGGNIAAPGPCRKSNSW
jgi:hypothetical protein